MADRSRYVAVVAAVLFVGLITSANASAVDEAASAETHGSGVDVVFTRQEDGGISGRARSGESSCEWHAAPYLGTSPYGDSEIGGSTGPRPSPSHELYLVWCGDASSFVWLGPNDFAENASRPLADELVRRLAVLPAGINVRPDNRGITGIPSMFWVDGYGAQPLSATESAFGLTVTVSIQLVEVEWNFGDGTPILQAGLGEAWPQRSSVQHTYRDTSGAGAFDVTATLLFQPTYTVDGTPGQALDPIQVPITRPYVVHQVQAQRTR